MPSLEFISKCTVDSVRVAELDNKRASERSSGKKLPS